jgi:hypothetical protein
VILKEEDVCEGDEDDDDDDDDFLTLGNVLHAYYRALLL